MLLYRLGFLVPILFLCIFELKKERKLKIYKKTIKYINFQFFNLKLDNFRNYLTYLFKNLMDFENLSDNQQIS